jgi:hypothetical protein
MVVDGQADPHVQADEYPLTANQNQSYELGYLYSPPYRDKVHNGDELQLNALNMWANVDIEQRTKEAIPNAGTAKCFRAPRKKSVNGEILDDLEQNGLLNLAQCTCRQSLFSRLTPIGCS